MISDIALQKPTLGQSWAWNDCTFAVIMSRASAIDITSPNHHAERCFRRQPRAMIRDITPTQILPTDTANKWGPTNRAVGSENIPNAI